jgi:ubiquitin fusion degradation protein 1
MLSRPYSPHFQKGDKILLPPSAFDTLARLNVDYPMLFGLSCQSKGTMTHCGVLEFTAEEGSCYIPFWMMQNLLIEEGTVLTITNVSLPKATFVKLQPQHVDFLEISNPRAVLEHALRNFSCVTKGDVIQIPYNNKNYHFELKEVLPQNAACIIETDCDVDFDAPVGYKEPEREESVSTHASILSSLPKQSAYNSSCPSPTPSSMSGISNDDESEPKGTRVVNGVIVRPDDVAPTGPQTEFLADRVGTTGVQRNAAFPEQAPAIDYWAIHAGDGARLDGKPPSVLKGKDGQEVDIRKVRAEAAAKREAAMTVANSITALEKKDTASKRKSRVGGKFSKLKTSKAFIGSANSMS